MHGATEPIYRACVDVLTMLRCTRWRKPNIDSKVKVAAASNHAKWFPICVLVRIRARARARALVRFVIVLQLPGC